MTQKHPAPAKAPNADQSSPVGGAKPRKQRISAKMREAIRAKVRDGATIEQACKKAGTSVSNWCARMQRPHYQQALEAEKAQYVQDVETMRAPYKAMAFEYGAWLMKHAKSDVVKARMVEFLAGDGQRGVVVNVQNNVNSGGYEYAPPNARIVDITPDQSGTDTA